MHDAIFGVAVLMAAAGFVISVWGIINDWRKKK